MTGASAVRVGIDLGGTKTRLVLLDPDGRVLASSSRPTTEYGVGPTAVDGLGADLRQLIGTGSAESIGVGASGPVLPDGTIDNPGTLPGFTGLDLAGLLHERTGIACRVDGDAVAAAVGEWRFGAGREARRLLMVTLGTGIGVALLDEGRPYLGADRVAPEAGHIPVSGAGHACYCGLENCWEQAASRRVLQQLAVTAAPPELIAAGPQAVVARLADTPAGSAVFAEYGSRVALGLMTLLTVYRPDVVVFGGSGAERFDLLLPGLRAGLGHRAAYHGQFELRPCELGDLGGAIGAACLPLNSDVGPAHAGI